LKIALASHYDGILETNNLTRINNFAEVIRFCSR
jgi:hypothetical protein